MLAPHDRGLPRGERWGEVDVRRFRYAPGLLERLAYRGGLAGRARTPLGLLLLPLFIIGFTVAGILAVLRHRAEVVHAHWWLPGGLAALVVSRLTGVPFVVTIHGSDAELLRRRALRSLGRFVLRRAAAVGAVSQTMADIVTEAVGLEDGSVAVLPMVVDVGRPPTPMPPRPPLRLVAAGRFSKEKGFTTLVQAVVRLRTANHAVELDLIGEGPQRRELARLAERAAPHVTISPFVPHEELWDRMEACHAVVVPSLHEGLGLTAVEALALGRPVVASRVGGLPEVVVDGADGVLVAPGDVDALVDALRSLPTLPPVGTAVRRHAPRAVSDAHDAAYATAAGVEVRRWRPWRVLGIMLGLATLAAVVRTVLIQRGQVEDAVRGADAGWLLAALGLGLLAEGWFALASAVVARTMEGRVAPLRRLAAAFLVGQNAKHLPGAVWPAVARLSLARRWGMSRRSTFRWLVVEALASVTGALAIGGALLFAADQRLAAGAALWAALVLPLAVCMRGTPVPRIARRFGLDLPDGFTALSLALVYLPAWALVAASSGAAAVALGADDGDLVQIGAAAVLASVAGFLVLPVPAGVGVREAVFGFLANGALATPVALTVALLARAIATGAQLGLSALALPLLGVRRRRERDQVP